MTAAHSLLATGAALLTLLAAVACGDSSLNRAAPSSSGSSGGSTSSSGGIVIGPSGLPLADDAPETALSGQVPLADQLSGRSAMGYRKGVKMIGVNPIMNRSANFALAWIGDCAYVTTSSGDQLGGSTTPYANPADSPLNGMAVLDVADATNPKLLSILQSPAMLRPHESLQANEARKIIVATASNGPFLDVYDASDCRAPRHVGSLTIGTALPPGNNALGVEFRGHALCLSDDGMTAYAAGVAGINNAAVDLRDIRNPKLISLFGPAAHDCGLSPDGNRLYLAVFAQADNGLVVLDSSDFQTRKSAPTFRTVGKLGWSGVSENETPQAGGHTARWFKQGSKTYVFSSDEWPTVASCPWSHSRIIDITDETRPVKVSDIVLDVNKAANCPTVTPDNVNYSMHYVGIDDRFNATTLFTTNYGGGLRVIDIRDVKNPKEIAYYHPKPLGNTPTVLSSAGFGGNGTLWDSINTYVRYRPETGHIWVAGFSSGFQVLTLTESAGPTAPRPTGR